MSLTRSRAMILGACTVPMLACGDGLSGFASFLDDPFGDISDEVLTLDEGELEAMMSELMLRFRSYIALRQAIPFESLAPQECVRGERDTGETFTFVADVACVFGADFAPASGEIAVVQQQLALDPVPVFRFELEYRDVVLGELTVDGSERITETDDSDGASVRKLDLVQDEVAFDYEFRAGLLEGETPVFDYQLKGPGGDVFARITNPTTAGGFVTVFLTGLDGTLQCEVRDSLWSPERLPRGSCDNGVVFGLPPEQP